MLRNNYRNEDNKTFFKINKFNFHNQKEFSEDAGLTSKDIPSMFWGIQKSTCLNILIEEGIIEELYINEEK